MKNRPSQIRTGLAIAAVMPLLLIGLTASAQDSRHSGGAGPAGVSGGAAAGSSGGGGASVASGGGSSSMSSGGGSSDTSGNTGSSFSSSGSGPSGVRSGIVGARDSATGGGGIAVGRAVHGADTSAYRGSTGGGVLFSDHTAGRVMGTDPATRNADIGSVPAYSRPRDGASVSGTAVPRGSVPMQPTGPGGGYSNINNGSAYGYYGLGGYYGTGYYACDPFGFNSGFYASCGRPYGYINYDPWMASNMMGAFSADPWYGGCGSSSAGTWTPDSPEDATLRLKIKPSQAEVFVDGYFVGVVNDFDGMFQKLHLESGAHRVEVRAPGYETLDIDIRLTSGKTTVYQGELTKIK